MVLIRPSAQDVEEWLSVTSSRRLNTQAPGHVNIAYIIAHLDFPISFLYFALTDLRGSTSRISGHIAKGWVQITTCSEQRVCSSHSHRYRRT